MAAVARSNACPSTVAASTSSSDRCHVDDEMDKDTNTCGDNRPDVSRHTHAQTASTTGTSVFEPFSSPDRVYVGRKYLVFPCWLGHDISPLRISPALITLAHTK